MASHHPNYKNIYLTLLVLLVISIVGPMVSPAAGRFALGVTLITAFGIAIVKANLVINNFMHLKWERRIIKWMLATSLALMVLFFFGIAPDVMKHEGTNWENIAAKASIEQGLEEAAAAGEAAH